MNRFGTGNFDTLKKESIRDELLEFHKKWYSSNIMNLCVYSNHSIEELEKLVHENFSPIINKNVVVHLSSVDVLHSYFLPNFRIKQDAVPGSWIEVWHNGTKSGKYELACAELCGSGHYAMRAVLNMQADADFAKWMDGKITAKKAVLAAEAANPQPVAPAPAEAAAPAQEVAAEAQQAE